MILAKLKGRISCPACQALSCQTGGQMGLFELKNNSYGRSQSEFKFVPIYRDYFLANQKITKDFVIKTNPQNESTINFDVQCAKIEQLYQYYLIPLSNIIHLAVEHPDRYLMEDWTKNKSLEQIKDTIYKIEEMYNRYLQLK